MAIMPRQIRVEYPGAIYHAMNHWDRCEPIFKEHQDRILFLAGIKCFLAGIISYMPSVAAVN
jgi:hypothetical protein